jgi:hypothetical protein
MTIFNWLLIELLPKLVKVKLNRIDHVFVANKCTNFHRAFTLMTSKQMLIMKVWQIDIELFIDAKHNCMHLLEVHISLQKSAVSQNKICRIVRSKYTANKNVGVELAKRAHERGKNAAKSSGSIIKPAKNFLNGKRQMETVNGPPMQNLDRVIKG